MIRIHYETVLAVVEAFAAQALRLQVLDPSERDYGGFRCPEHWICEPLAAANTLASLAVLYNDSRFSILSQFRIVRSAAFGDALSHPFSTRRRYNRWICSR